MAPPALPPETADPISAPVPAPIAPPARVPVCCDVWQADTEIAPASASARAIVFFIMDRTTPSTESCQYGRVYSTVRRAHSPLVAQGATPSDPDTDAPGGDENSPAPLTVTLD